MKNIEINPLVSVIVPVYNTERYLPRCLNSIINQEYENLEVLCVDDGSTDQSGQILDEYAKRDSRIKVYHIENSGVSAARNKALTVASGSYIGFVDSDDYLASDYYRSLVNALQNEDVDIATCSYYMDDGRNIIITENKEVVPTQPLPSMKFLLYMYKRDVYKGVGAYLWTRLIKREIIKDHDGNLQVFFRKEYGGNDDIVFVAETSLKSKYIQYIDKPLYFYFQREGSITHDDDVQLETLHWVEAYEEIINKYQAQGIDKDILDIIRRMYVYRCGKILEVAITMKETEKINILKEKIKQEFITYVKTNFEHLDRIYWILGLLLCEAEEEEK